MPGFATSPSVLATSMRVFVRSGVNSTAQDLRRTLRPDLCGRQEEFQSLILVLTRQTVFNARWAYMQNPWSLWAPAR
ncbi:unnamed protein product [Cercospora beticola]|nr:unnamed protein product [Cercospora beticola]